MRAFYDRTGHVKLWLHPKGTWLLDLHGHPLAFIDTTSVYDFKGRHVGWWDGTKIRDHHERLLVVDRDAMDLGAITPPYHTRPTPPTVDTGMPTRPTLGLKPSLGGKARFEWADAGPFLTGLAAVQPIYV